MRVLIPERHLRPSPRLLVGVAVVSCLTTFGLWQVLGRWALLLPLAWAGVLVWAIGYVNRSWIRISAERGLSWCLATKGFGTSRQLGSLELHAADIAELRLESSLLARLLGLWDLQIIRRDGAPVPRFRYFHGMDRIAEELHRYLQQG
jgi:hypothetical protein